MATASQSDHSASSKQSKASALFLRSMCPGCQRRMNVPVQLMGTTAKCPGCSQSIAVPLVDESVVGFDKLMECMPASTSPVPKSDQAGGGNCAASRNANHGSHDDLLDRSPFSTASPQAPEGDSSIDLPKPVAPNSRSASVPAGAGIDPRTLRLVSYFGIWLGPIVFVMSALVLDGAPVAGIILTGIFLALPWFYLGRIIASLLTPRILAAAVRTIRCPGCLEQVPGVSRWFCSCGYHDHRERTIFLFSCPQCSGRIGRTDCPQCESTILL